MKKIYLVLLLVFSAAIYSQTSGITYQAIVLNPEGKHIPGYNNNRAPLVNQNVCLRFKIYAGTTLQYQENLPTTTDEFGMVNVVIGSGTPTGGTASTFNSIVWNGTPKNLVVDVDLKGLCTNFTEISNQPLTAVPYALYAANSGTNGLAGPEGVAGPQGIQGIQGVAGPAGATGPQGIAGANGLSAYQTWLLVGNTGTQAQFLASLQGATGPQGVAGATGQQGQTGLQGLTGNKGNDGKTALVNTTIEPTGLNCPNGGTKIEVGLDANNNGILDTTEINASQTKYVCNGVQGPQGIQGLQGIAGANGVNGAVGPQGLIGLTGATGAQGIAGTNGIDGAQGSQGLQGIAGTNGLTGATGLQGPIGLTGATGSQGPAGTNGIDGAQGPQGLQGIAGNNGIDGLSAYQLWLNAGNTGTQSQFLSSLQGNQGVTGATGSQGPIGLTGAQGIQGLTGNTGAQGIAGINGTNGSNGLTGATGPAGLQGAQGVQGLTGNTGAQGPIGLTGPAGPQGIQGLTGNTGPAGINGTNGATGAQGMQGMQGIQGLTGDTGATGPQGTAGVNGTNGVDGKNTLVNTTTEAAGANCANGGTKIEVGLDANSNEILDTNEINSSLTKYVCNGTNATGGSGSGAHMQVFTAGTYSWTVPAGVTSVIVELWGAGGGGGKSYGFGAPATNGATGAYGKQSVNIISGQTYNITVGFGGSGVPDNVCGDGSTGGTTSFDTLLYATGGGGGKTNVNPAVASSNAIFNLSQLNNAVNFGYGTGGGGIVGGNACCCAASSSGNDGLLIMYY